MIKPRIPGVIGLLEDRDQGSLTIEILFRTSDDESVIICSSGETTDEAIEIAENAVERHTGEFWQWEDWWAV